MNKSLFRSKKSVLAIVWTTYTHLRVVSNLKTFIMHSNENDDMIIRAVRLRLLQYPHLQDQLPHEPEKPRTQVSIKPQKYASGMLRTKLPALRFRHSPAGFDWMGQGMRTFTHSFHREPWKPLRGGVRCRINVQSRRMRFLSEIKLQVKNCFSTTKYHRHKLLGITPTAQDVFLYRFALPHGAQMPICSHLILRSVFDNFHCAGINPKHYSTHYENHF